MYQLSDKQLDFILNDIRARGVEMESLQNDLLDHICCVIENNLEANGNFEDFYQKTIHTFYKHELWEIEEETISVLTFKNFYVMKKLMIISGVISATLLSLGLIFKFMFWPGASLFVVLGILGASFIFLPLMFTLRIKEKQNFKDKFILGIGSLVCILISLHVLFKVMHWPLWNEMGILAMLLLLVVFLPIYFFTGIRNPESKVNTIVSTVLIILGCGLVFTLIRSPKAGIKHGQRLSAGFIRNEQLFKNAKQRSEKILVNKTTDKNTPSLSEQIISECEVLKTTLLKHETNSTLLGQDIDKEGIYFNDTYMEDYLALHPEAVMQLEQLETRLKHYLNGGDFLSPKLQQHIFARAVSDLKNERSSTALNTFIQIQLFVLQNEEQLLAKN
jgi:hypothetical protein